MPVYKVLKPVKNHSRGAVVDISKKEHAKIEAYLEKNLGKDDGNVDRFLEKVEQKKVDQKKK